MRHMPKWEISSMQAGWLAAGVVAITGHALAVSQFLSVGGRDSWLIGALALPVAFVGIWSLARLGRRFPGQTLVQYTPKILGYFGYVVAAVFLVYFFLTIVFTLRMTTDWLADSILPDTPAWLMGALYMGAVLYPALLGLDVLARANQYALPVLTFLGMLIAAGTYPAKDYHLLLPLFEHGFGPVTAATFLGIGYIGEMSILGMFGAYVRPQDRGKVQWAYILALVYVIIALTGPLAGSIATLGYRVAQNMAYPTFQHWLTLRLARFFERSDLLAVHQWLVGAYVRCGVYLLMVSKGSLQLVGSKAKFTWVTVVTTVLATAASQLLFPTRAIFDTFIRSIYLPAGAVLGVGIPPLLLAVAWIRGLAKGSGSRSHGA